MTLSLLGIGLTGAGATAYAGDDAAGLEREPGQPLELCWTENLGLSGSKRNDYSHLITEVAEKKPFLISVNVAGHVDSSGNATLTSLVEGSTTIISIVPEGTAVKTGDIVRELDFLGPPREVHAPGDQGLAGGRRGGHRREEPGDSPPAERKPTSRRGQAQAPSWRTWTSTSSRTANTPSRSTSSPATSRSPKKTCCGSRRPTSSPSSRSARARTQNDLEAERIGVKQAELKLATAVEELKVLKEYDYNRRIEELKANAQEFKRELERTQIKCDAAVVQAKEDIKAKTLTAEAEKSALDRWKRQIDVCTIRAPQDGEVVYANLQNSSRGGSSPETITEGAQVRERQAIINLPDITRMKVDCRIHESQIAAVRRDLPARIRIEAFPDTFFNGMVTEVSSVPMSGRWPQMDLREYETEIKLTDSVEVLKTLRPGLTAQVEILVDNRDDVLQIPVQSVVAIGGRTFAFVLTETGPGPAGPPGRFLQPEPRRDQGRRPGRGAGGAEPRTRFAPEIAVIEGEVARQLGKSAAEIKIPAESDPAGGAPESQAKPGPAAPGGAPAGPAGPGGPGDRSRQDQAGAPENANRPRSGSPLSMPTATGS